MFNRHQSIVTTLGVTVFAITLWGGNGANTKSSEYREENSQQTTDRPPTLEDAIRSLDRVRAKVEEWGLVTISSPVAVLDSDAFYVPSGIRTPAELYEDAGTDINATAFQATEVSTSNRADVLVTPVTIPVNVNAVGGTAANSGGTANQTPAPGATPAPLRGSLDASTGLTVPGTPTPSFSTPNATAPFGLLSGTPTPKKSVTARLREAQDNTVKQKIYSEMTVPQGIPNHSRVIFAIVQVSCNPGWRTKENYIADCSASIEFYNHRMNVYSSRALERRPTVFSVLPLLDAQTVEMGNSQREITQLALQLAASFPAKGFDVKGKDLFEFVKRFSRDLRSVTPIPVVNSYSDGATFGFRFSPSFQALRDPAQKQSKAGNVLLPTTFPALISVIVHNEDLRVVQARFKEENPELNLAKGSKVLEGMALQTHISTRWYLKDHPPLWQLPKRMFSQMKRDTADMEISAAKDLRIIEDAKKKIADDAATDGKHYHPVLEELRREVIDLQSKGLGTSWPIPLDQAFLDAIDKEHAPTSASQERLRQLKEKDAIINDLRDQLTALQKIKAETGNSATDKGTTDKGTTDKGTTDKGTTDKGTAVPDKAGKLNDARPAGSSWLESGGFSVQRFSLFHPIVPFPDVTIPTDDLLLFPPPELFREAAEETVPANMRARPRKASANQARDEATSLVPPLPER